MVADQQGIGTVLSFGTKSVDPKILEQLLIGRDKNVEHLFKSIEGIVKHGNNQQTLVIGQRGMGKTHLLRVLYDRSQPFIKKSQLIVAYFSEDEYGIASYFDFLTRVLNAFIRWNENDAELLQAKLQELQDTANAAQTGFIEKVIRDYIADRPLLILAENFGDVLESMGRQEQGRLRTWLYENSRISIMATSQSISADFESEDRPFYGFFQLYYLKPLSFEDSERFLIRLAQLDDRSDIVEHLRHKGRAQVKAIHELVKGNHRLLVTFYEFLKSDLLARLSNHFIKTINDLKPYYETYIRYLPPQQQKILRYIALARKPQQGTVIAKNCFIDQKSLSKQLSELARKRLIEVIPDQLDKRNKLYDINEPLLRISIEIGEHKEGITALFVDFLALYYDREELEDKKLKYLDLLKKCRDSLEKRNFRYEIEAIDRALSLKKSDVEWVHIFSQVRALVMQSQMDKAYELLEAKRQGLSDDTYGFLLIYLHGQKREFDKIAKIFPNISAEFLHRLRIYGMWGYALLELAIERDNKKLLRESLDKFEKAAKSGADDAFFYSNWGIALCRKATYQRNESLYRAGIEKLKTAISLDDQDGDSYIELATAQIYCSMLTSDRQLAIDAFENFQLAATREVDEVELVFRWGWAISFTYSIYNRDMSDIKILKQRFGKLPADKRITVWEGYATFSNLYFFKEFFPLLRADITRHRDRLKPVIMEWVNNILSNNLHGLNKEGLANLREAVVHTMSDVPELEISRLYIDAFEQYVTNKNKNAVYELTKEQRLFFLEHIIGEKMEPESLG
ncbi:MAG TPA: hypothetical protein VG605_18205 [Puia sp.]|nr:hypothetical protein [Puia sp.]